MTTRTTTYLRFSVAGKSLLSVPIEIARRHDLFDPDKTLQDAAVEDLFPAQLLEPVQLMSLASSKLATLRTSPSRLTYVLQHFPRYVTALSGSFNDLLGRLSSKSRSTLKRKVKRFAKECGDAEVQFRQYTSAIEMREFLALAEPLAQRTYQARLFDGALPSSERFAREAVESAAEGRARGFLLFSGTSPVAYLYTPLQGDRLLYSYVGFDPAYGRLSPGAVLQYLVLERLFEDKPARYFDYTEGEGEHKALLATDRFDCCDVLCVPKTLRWRALLWAHGSWNVGIDFLRALAQRLGLLNALRRRVRQNAAGPSG